MNSLISTNETPADVINLILDLVIDIKTKTLDFDVLITLLKQWHNKKLVRELILELISNIEEMNIFEIDESKKFIVELIKINELGLAKKFYDKLIYSCDFSYNEYFASKNVIFYSLKYLNSKKVMFDTEEYLNSDNVMVCKENLHNLKKYIHTFLINPFLNDENLVERLFKIVDQEQLYFFYRDHCKKIDLDDIFFLTALKLKKDIFIILYYSDFNVQQTKNYLSIAYNVCKKYDQKYIDGIWNYCFNKDSEGY